MRKFIKNNSTVEKIILGKVLAANERWELPTSLWLKAIRSEELIPFIEDGTFTVDDGTTNLVPSDAVEWINNLYDLSEINIKKDFYAQIHKTKTGNNLMSNATWFDHAPSAIACGSYSGFGTSVQPIIIPFNCSLKNVLLNFRKANFDWRATAGSIFIELGFYSHIYNGASDYCRLGMTLSGSFSGNTTGDGTFKFPIEEIVARVGTNAFLQNQIIGVQLRKDISREGQIQSLSDPVLQLQFRET